MHSQTLHIRQIVLTLLIFSLVFIEGQNRPETRASIKNITQDLKTNRVCSIEQNVFIYSNRRKGRLKNKCSSKTIENYNQYGQLIESKFFKGRELKYIGQTKYYYADSINESLIKIETLNNKDSIVQDIQSSFENGKPKCMFIAEGVAPFGYYNLYYNEKGLITEAIYYRPKRGKWSNEKKVKYHLTKLTYKFR